MRTLLIVVSKRDSFSKRAIINRYKGSCAVSYRKTYFLLFLNNLWEEIKECGQARGAFSFHPDLPILQEKGSFFFSCNFNTFFQSVYSPGGSQSGGHVSIYFIHYLQFPSKMAVLFKNYPDKWVIPNLYRLEFLVIPGIMLCETKRQTVLKRKIL